MSEKINVTSLWPSSFVHIFCLSSHLLLPRFLSPFCYRVFFTPSSILTFSFAFPHPTRSCRPHPHNFAIVPSPLPSPRLSPHKNHRPPSPTLHHPFPLALILFSCFLSVPPKIMPFSFANNILSEGNRASLTCQILEGDLPVTFR